MTISAKSVRWGVSGKMIIDGVSVEAIYGGLLGLVGPNGSGKSTLLRLICRLRRVQSGVIALGDVDIGTMTRNALARRIALVEQQAPTESQVTVEDVVRLGRTPHLGPLSSWTRTDDEAVETALHYVDLVGKRAQSWHTLSGGEKQRTHIARALAQTPSELLLDEPTNHLDIQHQLETLKLVRNMPVTSIVALHDLNLAAMFCDSLAVLKNGRVVAAGPPSVILTAGLIWSVFGVQAHVEPSPHHNRPRVHYLPD